ncbi:hypothetical protein [Occallatibacter savannae]|uniref:hypothetical protein n=1 Tax=Occallatibacter savannae TaxID=1002691 RepID=UPI000D695672|nr:hypothetical protein [Occallatibacter savannae]
MNRADANLKLDRGEDGLEMEPELREAIGNFKSSVEAWSDAALSRPREATAPARSDRAWMTKWALGSLVFMATVSGAVYENHRQQDFAKAETARIAQQQQEMIAQRAKEEADLMARVDNDISREVPSALEPLASLMDENQGTGN